MFDMTSLFPSHKGLLLDTAGSGFPPCEHSQSERDNIENENNEVEPIPAITER